MKRSGKQLPKKRKFSPSSKLNCPNFKLKTEELLRVNKNVKEITFKGVFRKEKIKKISPETIIPKQSENNSSFHVK